jgi:hypothetical protein
VLFEIILNECSEGNIMFRNKTKALGRVAVAAALSMGLAISAVSVASAVGTKANTITASTAPVAGSVHGSYKPSATATSGDRVVITLDATSTGCSLKGGKVSFTGAGTCRVDFNDAGNSSFAAASQVQQSITVAVTGHKTQAAITLTSISGIVGRTLTLTSQGGSGTGGLSYAVTSVGTAGCSISGTALSATSAGSCTVTVTKAADANYAVAHSPATTVTFTHVVVRAVLHAAHVYGAVWVGRTVTVTISGTGFYGQPRITSNEVGTRAVVSRDTGKLLTVRVTVRAGSRTGWHTFTIRLANGKSCKVNYLVK